MAKAYAPKPAEVHASNVGVLRDRIKKNENLSGAYVFYGEEEYLKNTYYDKLAEVCGNKSLNIKTINGADFKLPDFINACDTAPAASMDMFSMAGADEAKPAYRLVRLISPKLSVLTKKDEKHFLSRIEDPDDGVIIVFWLYAGEESELTKGLYKQITDAALTVNFKHEAKGSPALTTWITKHFRSAKIEIERSVAMYMSSYVGSDMTTLNNEIDNCINYLCYENRDTVTIEDINFICKKSAEAQIFDISSNTLSGNYAEAMSALKTLITTAKSKDEAVGSVFGLISKAVYDLCLVESFAGSGEGSAMIAKKTGLHEFVVRKNLTLIAERKRTFSGKGSYAEYASKVCMEYDTLVKSSRTDRYELLREMIFKLCGN